MTYTADQLDTHMRKIATERELTFLDAIVSAGSQRKAAEVIGVAQSTISKALKALRVRVADTFVDPHRDPDVVAEGQRIKGTSGTQYVLDPVSGKWRLIWVKTERDPNLSPGTLLEAMRGVLEEFNGMPAENAGPHAQPVREDLIAVIPIGDWHFGQYSWAAECGDDYDLAIAKSNWRVGFDLLLGKLPNVCKIVGLNLGDLTHGDNSKNATPRSGFQLDMDGRHPKVVQAALECSLYAAYRCREKARFVKWRNNMGNHDPETSQMISFMMEAHFNGIHVEGIEQHERKGNSRIEVMTTPKDLEVVETFGNVMITSSHGEHTKPTEISGLLMDDFPKVVGAHPLRYHHSGHVHHRQRWDDIPGLTSFESHRTLAAKDKHAVNKYRAPRSMEAIVYHHEFGETSRALVSAAEIRAEVLSRG